MNHLHATDCSPPRRWDVVNLVRCQPGTKANIMFWCFWAVTRFLSPLSGSVCEYCSLLLTVKAVVRLVASACCVLRSKHLNKQPMNSSNKSFKCSHCVWATGSVTTLSIFCCCGSGFVTMVMVLLLRSWFCCYSGGSVAIVTIVLPWSGIMGWWFWLLWSLRDCEQLAVKKKHKQTIEMQLLKQQNMSVFIFFISW